MMVNKNQITSMTIDDHADLPNHSYRLPENSKEEDYDLKYRYQQTQDRIYQREISKREDIQSEDIFIPYQNRQ
jgi:hypothetical protein